MNPVGRLLRLVVGVLAVTCSLLLPACNRSPDPYGKLVKFKDDVASNTRITGSDLAKLTFQDPQGETVTLGKYRGQKNVVLVITRGYVGTADPEAQVGSFCTYCCTQAARLIANYDEFTSRDAEVMLVFPIVRRQDLKQVSAFADKVRYGQVDVVPFPLVVDLDLAAVERLGIRADLAKPATYILDKKGEVRFAYVGETLSDRPSVKAMVAQLDMMNAN